MRLHCLQARDRCCGESHSEGQCYDCSLGGAAILQVSADSISEPSNGAATPVWTESSGGLNHGQPNRENSGESILWTVERGTTCAEGKGLKDMVVVVH